MTISDCPFWDDRTETVILSCIGGPWDGATCPVPPKVRTVTAPNWTPGMYYEVQAVRNVYRLVWHSTGGKLWIALAEQDTTEPTP